jgi:membrane protein
MRSAAALSYSTLLALVPLVTVVFSMLSLFPVMADWRGTVEAFIFSNFVPTAGEAVAEHLRQFTEQAGRVTAIGLLFLILSSLLLLATIESVFNQVWRVHRGRSIAQKVVVYWTMLTLGPLLLVASISVTSYVVALPASGSGESSLASPLFALVALGLEFAAFLLLYMVIPNRRVPVGDAAIGAGAASVLFEVAKRAFVVYVGGVANYQVIYGAISFVPIFIVWIYISWLIVLTGAYFAAARLRLAGSGDGNGNERRGDGGPDAPPI